MVRSIHGISLPPGGGSARALDGRSGTEAGGGRRGEALDVIEPAGVGMLGIGGPGRPRRLLPFVREFVLRVGEEEIEVAPPAGWKEL